MAKETWKAGNMLYPLPAVMVSVSDGEGNDNIITVAWAGTVCTNKEMKLTKEKADFVKVPMIAESPVSIECKVRQVLELGSHHMFLADVLAVHADPQYMDEKKKFHLNDAKPLVYSHGEYLGIGKKLGTFGYSVKKKKKPGKKKQ